MASPPSNAADDEVLHRFAFFTVYKDGHVILNWPPSPTVPPSDAPVNGVQSKDVVISGDPRVTARVFLPENAAAGKKLPVLLYAHGGGFCMGSPFAAMSHDYVAAIYSASGAVAVSVDYGLFPARPMPACFDDSWAALQWIAAHSDGAGPDPWLNAHADLSRVVVAGDSAGGTITHDIVSRFGRAGLPGVRISGAAIVHPYFAGTHYDEMIMYMWPGNKAGTGNPTVSPTAEDLGGIGCEKVLVFVAEKDVLAGPGKRYVEELRKSDWPGSVEIVETLGEGHCFHFGNPKSEKAVELFAKLVAFIKQD